jgi:hypothetical protein
MRKEFSASDASGARGALPYADLVDPGNWPDDRPALANTEMERYFPFYRTRIVNYPGVSSVLYDLLRDVMSLVNQGSDDTPPKGPGEANGAQGIWAAWGGAGNGTKGRAHMIGGGVSQPTWKRGQACTRAD